LQRTAKERYSGGARSSSPSAARPNRRARSHRTPCPILGCTARKLLARFGPAIMARRIYGMAKAPIPAKIAHTNRMGPYDLYRKFAYDEGMKKKIGSAETFERSPRCRIARDSRIWPQNRSQITVRGRKSSFTIFYLHLPPFYLHLVPSLVAKCTGKRPQKTPKLAVKWPGSAGREQSARAPGIG
jgi:hypothetical protein